MSPQQLPPIRPPLLHDIIGGLSRLPTRIGRWRDRRRVSPLWTVAVAVIFALVALPLLTIAGLAVTPAENIWPHLMRYVLPGSLATTLGLMIGVGVVTAVVGTATAWVITMYRFPGRAVLDRLLVVPLAMPTYVVAYCYEDLLDYSGPAQRAVRALGGWTSARDYWFPDVHTLSGAIFVMSGVLYPYVYLAARASFVQQSVCALEVARTLGQTAMGAFRTVALPLARPAIAAGVALVLMETLNDLGAVQHLGVETLTQSIYTTWLKRSNLGGAAQLAVVMLLFVVALFGLEYLARGEARFHHTTGRYRSIPFSDLAGWRATGAIALCLAPFLLGFLVPSLVLVTNAVTHYAPATAAGFWQAARNSILLSLLAAAAATGLALIVAYARRIAANGFTRPAVSAIGLGYAVPGTVLALGLMIPLAAFDNRVDALMRAWFGVSTGLILSGTLLVLVLAYVVRFLAVALGSIEAGLLRISPNLDAAARTLGETALSALWRVHLPLLLPPLGAAGLLVFVDCMKELPATVLLRPFNFETLATHVYSYASLEQFETASVGALTIVLAGLVPVLLLHRAVAGGRAGGKNE